MPSAPSRPRPASVLAIAVLVGFALAASVPARAAGDVTHKEHNHWWDTDAGPDLGTTDPVIAAFRAANDKMRRDMTNSLTGDADRDFVVSMIPHHQGAIEMADIVLKYGKDATIRALAQKIISEQQKEIARMKAWLAQQRK